MVGVTHTASAYPGDAVPKPVARTGRSAGPTVAIMGELDSLIVASHPYADPQTHAAHTCGHNAMIGSMLGAGFGLDKVMDQLDGDVVLFAVPAEEGIELEYRLGLRERVRSSSSRASRNSSGSASSTTSTSR